MNIGVIVYGYWGPNIVRNFSIINGVNVTYVCDKKDDALNRVRGNYP